MNFSPTEYLLDLARAAQSELGSVVDLHFDDLCSQDPKLRAAAEAAVNAGLVRVLGFHAVNAPPFLPSQALAAAMVLQALVLRPGTQPDLERELGGIGLAGSSRVRDGLESVQSQGTC